MGIRLTGCCCYRRRWQACPMRVSAGYHQKPPAYPTPKKRLLPITSPAISGLQMLPVCLCHSAVLGKSTCQAGSLHRHDTILIRPARWLSRDPFFFSPFVASSSLISLRLLIVFIASKRSFRRLSLLYVSIFMIKVLRR